MSTKIYNAVKINTANMSSLISIAKEISKIEKKNFIDEIAAEYKEFFVDLACNKAINYEDRNFRTFCNLLMSITKSSSLLVLQSYEEEILKDFTQKNNLSIDYVHLYELHSIFVKLCNCRTLSFFYLDGGHTLMKWYTLSKKTEEWIYKKFKDYHYQNSTDGYTLKEADSDLAKAFSEIFDIDSFCKRYNITKKPVDDVLDAIASCLIDKRGEDWDKALKGAYSFNESSLSYNIDVLSNNSAYYYLVAIIRMCTKEIEVK